MYEGKFESFFKASPYGSLLLTGFFGPLEETSGRLLLAEDVKSGFLLSPLPLPKNKLPKPPYERALPNFVVPKVTLATFFIALAVPPYLEAPFKPEFIKVFTPFFFIKFLPRF